MKSNVATCSEQSDRLNSKLAELRGWVDLRLERLVHELPEGCPDHLRRAMAYSLLAPGKRLRPCLFLLAAEAVGADLEPDSELIQAALSVECIHCYSLIHDDLPAMDDDDMRRGRPTLHREFDEATAILAGDGLQALAFETLLESGFRAKQLLEASTELARAAGPRGLVGGQADDLLFERSNHQTAKMLEFIHARKTSAMIVVSCRMGGILANADTFTLGILGDYARDIGLAFQIVDDCLDCESDAATLGKTAGKDAATGKLTYPSLYGLEQSRKMAGELVEQAVDSAFKLASRGEYLGMLAAYVLNRTH